MSTPMTAKELLDAYENKSGWYCFMCGKFVEGRDVTYDERHTACRTRLIDHKDYATAQKEAPRIIRELQARVAELEALTAPRPIEDAPKNEQVLVFCPEEHDYGYTAAWVVGEYVLHSCEGHSRLEDGVQPTHWIPLPPDPLQADPTTETNP